MKKPEELLACYEASAELFDLLRTDFAVPPTYELKLGDIDAAETELQDIAGVAAFAMRKLQALRYVSRPGVRTTNDVVVGLVAELNRALLDLAEARNGGHELRRYRAMLNRAGRSVMGRGDILELE